jgi:hypothetical protein
MAAALTYLPPASRTHTSSVTGQSALVREEPATREPRGMAIAAATLALARRVLADTVDIGSLEIEVDVNETVKIRVGFEPRDAPELTEWAARGPSFGDDANAWNDESRH